MKRPIWFLGVLLAGSAAVLLSCGGGGGTEAVSPPPQSGTLDKTFNGEGFVTHDNAAGGNGSDWGTCVAIDGSGRLVVAGESLDSSGNKKNSLWRYNTEGTLDVTFDGKGYTTQEIPVPARVQDLRLSVAIDNSGRIITAGQLWNPDGNYDMAIWRYNADGTPDNTFGGNGFVTHDSAAGGSRDDRAFSVTIDGTGRIVVAGRSGNSSGDSDLAIWRYNDDGTLDTTFDGKGYVTHDNAAGGSGSDLGNSVAIHSSGWIVVAGESWNPSGNFDLAIWRYNDDGTPDATFGGKGYVIHDNVAGGADETGFSVAFESSGRIVVAGRGRNPTGDFDLAIWRYNDGGTLDTAFNGKGYVTHDNAAGGSSDDRGYSVAIDSNGRFVVSGESVGPFGTIDMALWRFTNGGELDTTFGGKGYVIYNGPVAGSEDNKGYSVAIGSSGRIVVAGRKVDSSGNSDLVIWRYNP